MPTTTRKTTTQRGLGWRHRQAAAHLHRTHQDRTKCDWCGRPMHKDPTRNWDYNPNSTNPNSGKLHADHSGMSRSEAINRGLPIPLPDRLLHGACNIQRGNGGNDHLANTANKTNLAMPWPWAP